MTLAHRMSQKENSPVVRHFESKPDAMEVFRQARESKKLSLEATGLGGIGEIEIRHHLSTFLSELLKTANLIRKDAGWMFCRPITSNQTVELTKSREQGAERYIASSLQDLYRFRDRLVREGSIKSDSPAAKITTGSKMTLRKRQRQEQDEPAYAAKRPGN